jgi:protein-tyrosine phosphatase
MSGPEPNFRVLFVCTGNTCRSPLAEVALKRMLGESAERVEVRSAGVSAWDGAPASDGARAVARAHGLDLEHHRSRRLTSALLKDQDLVLLMNPGDLLRVRALDPDGGAEVFGLADFAKPRPEGTGIPDPYGGPPEAYEAALARIEEHLGRVVPYIQAELREREVGARKPS